MSKIKDNIKLQIRYFFINEFWKNIPILAIVVLLLILNWTAWYLYMTKYREVVGITPVLYSSAVLLLNLFLAVITYRKQVVVSYVFLGSATLIQILFLNR